MRLITYLIPVLCIAAVVFLVVIGLCGVLAKDFVMVLLAPVAWIGGWAWEKLQKSEAEEKALIKPVYAPLYEDLQGILEGMKMFRGLPDWQEQRAVWARIRDQRDQYLIPKEFRKKLEDFYEVSLPEYVELFRRARELATNLVAQDLRDTARLNNQMGERVTIARQDGSIERPPFSHWIYYGDPKSLSEAVPVETILLSYETIPKSLERTYGWIQQVLTLPTSLSDYISKLRAKTQQRPDVKEMLEKQQAYVRQAEDLLNDLKKKARA